MSDKQSRELYLLERFLPELLDGKSYSLIQPAPPLPDVIIHIDGKLVGIEITDLIPDSGVRQREAAQDAIVSQAQCLFEARHPIPLHVSVDFVESVDWKRVDRKQAAVYLANCVEQQIKHLISNLARQSQFDICINDVGHTHIQGFSLFYLDRLTESCWSPITSFWVPEISSETVQAIIQRKSNNVGGYLTGCEEVWLLILETGSPSSYFGSFEKLVSNSFISSFSKTLIGRVSKGEIIELKTSLTT
ncbi:hypothetical protein [Hymenobacter yonginensis]|uniref:Uncharacterized protein n=1 Tax=Hymenobacter yonginensis TaxID=748197 RepID=A0ABY7PUC5_9BACT|nr:hypothetical protein [Hymenobacter yonginensis]WBO86212.1 hypothetical protein O9Z63_08115 [Hymenobacter yonginensis]